MTCEACGLPCCQSGECCYGLGCNRPRGRAYAGIGSRSTPPDMLGAMRGIALHLAYRGWTLRSGCAEGADSAFETGAFDARMMRSTAPRPELYLPWPKFNERRSAIVTLTEPQPEAYEIARQFHPAWDRLSRGVRALHARNVHQIMGRDVTAPDLSRFVICWTADGKGGGGTGQAIRIANHYDVPVFDLAIPTALTRIQEGLFA